MPATSASSGRVISAGGNTVVLQRCHGVGWSLEKNDAVGVMDKEEINLCRIKDYFKGICLGPRETNAEFTISPVWATKRGD